MRIRGFFNERFARSNRTTLVREIAVVLVIKIMLLVLLWHVFIKPNKVAVDADAMSGRIATIASQPPTENKNDRLGSR